MKVLGRFATAAAAVFLSSGVASAADMMAAEYVETAAPALTGFYGSMHAGYYMPSDTDLTIIGPPSGYASSEDGYRVGGSLGYDFNANIGAEVEVSYATGDIDSLNFGGVSFGTNGDGSSLTMMGNVIVGQHYGAWRPYVGAGVGAARVSIDSDFLSGLHDDDWAAAGQLLAGVDYSFTDTVSLGGRYRFQYIGSTDYSDGDGDPVELDALKSHSIEAVLKVRFAN